MSQTEDEPKWHGNGWGKRMLEGRYWHRTSAVAPDSLQSLKLIAPKPLPKSYLDFLEFSNGGEGPLSVQPLWLCLYPAEEVEQIAREGTFQEYFGGLFVIGGNGAGEAIAFDFREQEPFPIVAFDMTNIDLAESVMPIAPNFEEMLGLIGMDEA